MFVWPPLFSTKMGVKRGVQTGVGMARKTNILNPLKIKATNAEGVYADGNGLYLQVNKRGAKSWLFCYALHGKSREMGLGALDSVTLAEARLHRDECKKLLAAKIDPIENRKTEQAKARLDAARNVLFKDCAEMYFEANKSGWKNKKHTQQFTNTFKTYVYPVIGNLPVQGITVDLVMKVLNPIWKEIPETANRVRGRMEAVLDFAHARELRQGENPARWRGRLQKLLPHRSKIRKVQHHPALPYAKVADFMALLKQQPGLDALALQFTILTAARTGEVVSARWSEIDMHSKVWTIPAERMKAGKEHRVPLTEEALTILKAVDAMASGKHTAATHADVATDWVFPGRKGINQLSGMAMLMLLRRMERKDITVHGFRSTFRDWVAEQTAFPYEVAEGALAHTIGNKVAVAYLRSDLFEKRRKLMEAWARYCHTPSRVGDVGGNVVALGAR